MDHWEGTGYLAADSTVELLGYPRPLPGCAFVLLPNTLRLI